MKFTNYFSRILKSQGVPHLDTDAFAVYMNIVHLEGRITQLNDLASQARDNDRKFAYRLDKEQLEYKIQKLTQHQEPSDYLDLLVRMSQE